MGERKRQLREEVAELAQAVRELREQLAAHHCHGCTCVHYYWPNTTWAMPVTSRTIYTSSVGGQYTIGTGGAGDGS